MQCITYKMSCDQMSVVTNLFWSSATLWLVRSFSCWMSVIIFLPRLLLVSTCSRRAAASCSPWTLKGLLQNRLLNKGAVVQI